MPEPIARYSTRVRGLWNTRHEISNEQGRLGVLAVTRNAGGIVTLGRFTPDKGEVLVFRRDPGILRSQFSAWTDGREWLGSSLRAHFLRRQIDLSTGNKPYRLLPKPGFQRGWRMLAPKTGEMATLTPRALSRGAEIQVFRRLDFELVLFAYFLGSAVWSESFWPGPDVADDQDSVPSPSQA